SRLLGLNFSSHNRRENLVAWLPRKGRHSSWPSQDYPLSGTDYWKLKDEPRSQRGSGLLNYSKHCESTRPVAARTNHCFPRRMHANNSSSSSSSSSNNNNNSIKITTTSSTTTSAATTTTTTTAAAAATTTTTTTASK
ncbi:hypothetical protein PoB_000684100, partial [Plakobranchus ocellatus]